MLKDEESVQFSGKLNPLLEHGNNRLKRAIKENVKEGRRFIDNISNGTVVDYLLPETEQKVVHLPKSCKII